MRVGKIKSLFSTPASWVVIAGFSVRLYSALARCIVNADAHHYIYQAKVIYAGAWSELFSCSMKHISTYPFFTAMVFAIVRDWITAGLIVNILFGTAVLVPLYFLLLRFTEKNVSALCVLVFAFIPTFVNSSGDILRDPVFCFFVAAGMYFFVRHRDQNAVAGRFRQDLALSGLCFVLAACTRIEGVLFLLITPGFLLLGKSGSKGKTLFFFMLPLIGIGAAGLIFVLVSGGNATMAFRIEKVWREITQFVRHYGLLDDQLKAMIHQNDNLTGEFLRRAREALWLMPLAILLHNGIEVFFYPYAFIFLIGFIGIYRRIKTTPGAAYFLCLMLGSVLVLSVHLIQTWLFIHRFMAIFILPSCLVIAWGIENSIRFLSLKFNLSQATAVRIVLAFIVLAGLPKALIARETDKAVYREAARLIQDAGNADEGTGIFSIRDSRAYDWVMLYTHRKALQPICALGLIRPIPDSYTHFLEDFDKADLSFLMLEERYWPKKQFDFMSSANKKDFRLLGQWEHPDSGRLMIFQRTRER